MLYDFPAAVEALAVRARAERPRWSPTLTPAIRRLRQIAECTLDRADLLRLLDREQQHAQDTDPDWHRGAWRAEMLGSLREVLATPAELAALDALAVEAARAMADAR